MLPSKYRRCLSAVLESVLSRITKDILLLDDIAVEETLEVQLYIITVFSLFTFEFERSCLTDNLVFVASKTHSFDVRQHITFIRDPNYKSSREIGGEFLVQS